MKQVEFKVAGMTCGACVARVTRTLLSIPGVHDAEVDLARGVARAQVDDIAAYNPPCYRLSRRRATHLSG